MPFHIIIHKKIVSCLFSCRAMRLLLISNHAVLQTYHMISPRCCRLNLWTFCNPSTSDLTGQTMTETVKFHAIVANAIDYSRPVARGVQGVRHTKSAESSTFSHKVGHKWGFCRRAKGARFKKSTFGVKRSTFWWFSPPQIQSWLQALTTVTIVDSRWSKNLWSSRSYHVLKPYDFTDAENYNCGPSLIQVCHVFQDIP